MSLQTFISLLENVVLMLPALLTVAFVTVAERKTMASMQRRLGPNAVGYYGLLQAFADALKLIIKEYVAPTQANIILFFLGPIVTLVFCFIRFCCNTFWTCFSIKWFRSRYIIYVSCIIIRYLWYIISRMKC